MRKTVPALLCLVTLTAPATAAEIRCTGVSGHLGRDRICAGAGETFRSSSAALTIEVLQDEPNRLSARIGWSGGQGPRVDVTSPDQPLDGRAVPRLMQGLRGSTDLP
ncbi:hypothetical protein [Falsigemmobacter faecalis]|uniref:Uncharacterized protein n=1 Tax=Falsigemmobacter faecalis TaxID=2488730 RepID=A0A3P3DQM3_9RHOB|nr:hypothetical protein [Falsigemmobacter faecalis]RRH76567.1 hypothetical protein EG244_05185 [Falsigemmobacter faecalis]